MDLHIPASCHDRMVKAVTCLDPVSVKLDLIGTPKDRVYVTLGQKKEAVADGKRDMMLRLSANQAKHNIESEGGFLAVSFRRLSDSSPVY